MTNVSSNSSASQTNVSSFTFKMKALVLAKALPLINGESSTTTLWKATLHSIRPISMNWQDFHPHLILNYLAISKLTVSASVELLSICRSVASKLVLSTEELVAVMRDACTNQHSLPLMHLLARTLAKASMTLTVKQATSWALTVPELTRLLGWYQLHQRSGLQINVNQRIS